MTTHETLTNSISQGIMAILLMSTAFMENADFILRSIVSLFGIVIAVLTVIKLLRDNKRKKSEQKLIDLQIEEKIKKLYGGD